MAACDLSDPSPVRPCPSPPRGVDHQLHLAVLEPFPDVTLALPDLGDRLGVDCVMVQVSGCASCGDQVESQQGESLGDSKSHRLVPISKR